MAPKGAGKGKERAVVARSSRARSGLVGGRPLQTAGAYDYSLSVWNMLGRRTAQREMSLRMLKYIRDYDPDAAMAIWNFIRLSTRIKAITVFEDVPGGDDTVEDVEGQALIDDLNDPNTGQVGREYGGGLQSIATVLVLTLMTNGAMALEVGLAQNLKEIIGIFPVDPGYIEFQYDENRIPHPVVVNMSQPVPINEVQFRYLPMDPDVDEPQGRSPLWPSFDAIQFKTEVLRDLKAVSHNQGHARIDVKVLESIMLENLQRIKPSLFTLGRESDLQSELDAYLSDLQTSYNSLNPDDAFIHWDAIEVGSAGADHGTSMDIKALMEVIDRQVVAALKSLPILIGRNDSATTTHATVQWQIFAQTVEAVQDKLKTGLEWACNLCLRVWGRQSRCEIVFEAPRKSDRYQDAQAAKMEADTWKLLVDMGWATDDEAAMAILGHEAQGEKAPPPPNPFAKPEQESAEEGEEEELEEVETEGEGESAEEEELVEEEPRIMGRALRAEFKRQVGDDFSGEAAELFQTPTWMQFGVRRANKELHIVDRKHFNNAYQALMAVPDSEWEAAMEADAKAAAEKAGGNGNGRGT